MGNDRSPSPPFILFRPRREVFDYGILPFLTSTVNPTLFLSNLKHDFRSSSKIHASVLSDALKVSEDRACFIIDTIASILPDDGKVGDRGVVDVDHLVLFLYLQNYKRMAPCRINKDSPAVSDVWPSNSAFDKCISIDSPRQFVRSNSRHFMPSQADEEIHQLSYLQKNIANMLTLLIEPMEGEGSYSLVSTLDRFEHLGLLIQFFKDGYEEIPLRKAVSFFTNSDEYKPNLSAPATQISEWVLQNIDVSLEYSCQKVTEKERGQHNAVDVSDGSSNHTRNCVVSSLLPAAIEGISKISVVKKGHDIKGSSVKVMNCHGSVIYILAPLRYATISGCSDATVVLGAVGKTVRVEGCERIQIITAAKRICVINCRECIYYMGVNERPVFLGDNHKLQVAPYNTFYSQLNEHISQVSLDVNINRWNEPLVLGMTDPHDLSQSAGMDDVEAETLTCIGPHLFSIFVIPDWFGKGTAQPTKANPFVLPEKYTNSLMKFDMALDDIQQAFRDAQLGEENKRELIYALHLQFKEWLYASGNVRQLYCLQDDCRLEQGLVQPRI